MIGNFQLHYNNYFKKCPVMLYLFFTFVFFSFLFLSIYLSTLVSKDPLQEEKSVMKIMSHLMSNSVGSQFILKAKRTSCHLSKLCSGPLFKVTESLNLICHWRGIPPPADMNFSAILGYEKSCLWITKLLAKAPGFRLYIFLKVWCSKLNTLW